MCEKVLWHIDFLVTRPWAAAALALIGPHWAAPIEWHLIGYLISQYLHPHSGVPSVFPSQSARGWRAVRTHGGRRRGLGG